MGTDIDEDGMNICEGNFQTGKGKMFRFFIAIHWLCAIFFTASANSLALPPGFVYLEDLEPVILVDLRYSGKNNFIGRPIDGYLEPRCIMTEETALALIRPSFLAKCES